MSDNKSFSVSQILTLPGKNKMKQMNFKDNTINFHRIGCKSTGFFRSLVGAEKITNGEFITSLEATLELKSPRINEPTNHYGYEVFVSVDYGNYTKLTFAGKNISDLWFNEREILRGAFPNHTVNVKLDFYVGNEHIGTVPIDDKYNVPKVFSDVIKQSIDYLVDKALMLEKSE